MADETAQGSEAIAATARLLGGGLAAVVAVAGTFRATTGGLARPTI